MKSVDNVDKKKSLRILAIETSCDETAISIAGGSLEKPEITVLANVLISQIEIHKPYGGVFPALAKREHQRNLPILLAQALGEARTGMDEIDMIAVTYGPGLEPALWTGINFAEELAAKWKKPLVPVNHMEGHIVIALLKKNKIQKLDFPAIALLISGGHTELVLMRDWFQYEIVGETRDDAAGECFDKTARILGLPYPGGPEISKLAEKFRSTSNQSPVTSNQLPRPMLHSKDFDFSFSGLKTAVLYTVKKLPKLTQKIRREIAFETEEAITDVLVAKTLAAVKKFGARSVVLGGGVAANAHIQKIFSEKIPAQIPDAKIFLPEKNLTTDNALMIALAAYLRAYHKKLKAVKNITAKGNLRLGK